VSPNSSEFGAGPQTHAEHDSGVLSCVVMLDAVMHVRIGERHASACRYKNEVPAIDRKTPVHGLRHECSAPLTEQ